MAKAENSNSAAEAARSAQPDVQAAFNEAFAAADSLAAQRLQTIGKLHQARIARLTREAAGFAKQGDAGAASLAGARAEIAAEKITVAKAAMLNQRAATADPQVPPSGWALHGRVYSSELAPAAGCTVFLVDPQNAFQSAYGFAYTTPRAISCSTAPRRALRRIVERRASSTSRSRTPRVSPSIAARPLSRRTRASRPIRRTCCPRAASRSATLRRRFATSRCRNVRRGSVAGRVVARPRRGL